MIKKRYIKFLAAILIGLICVGCSDNEMETQNVPKKFGLAGTIKIQSIDSTEYIKIYSCFRENEDVYATMEIKIPQMVTKENIGELFEIIDKKGKKCEYTIEEYVEKEEKRLVVIKIISSVEVQENERYDLIYKGNTLPIIFSELDEKDMQATVKNLDSENGITVAAFPYYSDEQVATVAIAVTNADGDILTKNIENAMVTVHDNDGNPYSVRMNGETVEIVNAMFSDGLIMEVADVTNNKVYFYTISCSNSISIFFIRIIGYMSIAPSCPICFVTLNCHFLYLIRINRMPNVFIRPRIILIARINPCTHAISRSTTSLIIQIPNRCRLCCPSLHFARSAALAGMNYSCFHICVDVLLSTYSNFILRNFRVFTGNFRQIICCS